MEAVIVIVSMLAYVLIGAAFGGFWIARQKNPERRAEEMRQLKSGFRKSRGYNVTESGDAGPKLVVSVIAWPVLIVSWWPFALVIFVASHIAEFFYKKGLDK